MARKPNRGRRALSRLLLEPLEDRRLLALAAFNVNLYRDLGGIPGELITDDTVQVGDEFFVEITAQDVRVEPVGIHGISIDVVWNPDILVAADAPFDPNQLVTSKLPAFQLGTLDNSTGRIDNLGGSAFLSGELLGKNGPERFSLLHFEALAPATESLFVVDAGSSGIAFYPPARTKPSDFFFETQTITVVAALENPLEESNSGDEPGDGTATLSAFEVNVYQDSGGIPFALIPGDAVDPTRSFFVQIILEPATDAPQPTGGPSIDAGAGAAPSGETDETAGLAGSWARLDVSSLGPFAGGAIDIAPGDLLVTQVVVRVQNVIVDLPLAAGPVDEAMFVVEQTQRIGLSFFPHAERAAAADAVLAAVPTEELASTARVDVDHALLQAVASALAAALVEDEISDPFGMHPI